MVQGHDQESRMFCQTFRWLVTDRPQNLITGPLGPLPLLDLCVSFYPTCLPKWYSERSSAVAAAPAFQEPRCSQLKPWWAA